MNYVSREKIIEAIDKLPQVVLDENYQTYEGKKYKRSFEEIIACIGVVTYGKERWFLQDNGVWYDREDSKYIDLFKLKERVWEALVDLSEMGDEK